MTLHPKLGLVYHQVLLSNHLEKIAQAYRDDSEVSTAAMQVKLAVDAEAFAIIKDAGFASTLGKRLLIGGATALPVLGTGAYLLHKARQTGEEMTSDMRDKILQTALGIGGIGAGIYGLHKLLSKSDAPKTAEDSASALDDAMAKLATIAAIECMLDAVSGSVSEETQKLAAELRVLNRGYGMRILYALVSE